MPPDLLDALPRAEIEPIRDGITLLPGLADDPAVVDAALGVIAAAPPRHMVTPGGLTMSVAMTCCGDWGWVTDRQGYRYSATDPETGQPWPAIPPVLSALAGRAAARAGFPGFAPDACLVNRYVPGARLTLHQDRDERDFRHPVVSISLGLPATFVIGGATRAGPTQPVRLVHGDVLVFGGPARLAYHGVKPLQAGQHPVLGAMRLNLTLRRAR